MSQGDACSRGTPAPVCTARRAGLTQLLFVSAFVMAPLMEWSLGKNWVERLRGVSEEE